MMNISVDCSDTDQFKEAKKIASEFEINLKCEKKNLNKIQNEALFSTTGLSSKSDLKSKTNLNTNSLEIKNIFLSFENNQFVLKSEDGLSLVLSFLEDRRYRRIGPAPKKELISKACGWHLGCRTILDLTAGLAADSVFLTQAGFKVTSLERHHVLFLLLKFAQKTATENQPNGIWKNLKFIAIESAEYLKTQLTEENRPDVIYYDPMYPSSNKVALPNKEMQIFRRLLGENEADVDLLDLAILKTAKIVVIKRPIKALPLQTSTHRSPTRSYVGKLVRFDVYSR
jgi:16S rRNA (guanine1516-N2)-methyltransferase